MEDMAGSLQFGAPAAVLSQVLADGSVIHSLTYLTELVFRITASLTFFLTF